jgi:hypothetical protein
MAGWPLGIVMATHDQFQQLIDLLERAKERGCALSVESAALLLTAIEGTLEQQSLGDSVNDGHRFRLEMFGKSGAGFEELLGLTDDKDIAQAMFRQAIGVWPDRRIVLFDRKRIVDQSTGESP